MARSSLTYRSNRIARPKAYRLSMRMRRVATHPFQPRGKVYPMNGARECVRRRLASAA